MDSLFPDSTFVRPPLPCPPDSPGPIDQKKLYCEADDGQPIWAYGRPASEKVPCMQGQKAKHKRQHYESCFLAKLRKKEPDASAQLDYSRYYDDANALWKKTRNNRKVFPGEDKMRQAGNRHKYSKDNCPNFYAHVSS